MRIAPRPLDEALRLQDLYGYDILDSEKDQEYDDLLETAAQIYNCPIAAISFIDSERQWLKSRIGLPEGATQTSRDVAFCAHTILEEQVLVVEDAARDDRFCSNPEVQGGLFIRFYAGAPIMSPSGYKLGSVCVVDNKPRRLSTQETKALQVISRQVSRLLELRLKNKRLAQQAETLLYQERNLLHRTLQRNEADKGLIRKELHENIGQNLAALQCYLDLAESNTQAVGWITKGKQLVHALLKQVRDLSHTIAPSLLHEVELRGILTEVLISFSHQTQVRTTLRYEGREVVFPSLGLVVYRIVEEQLQNIRQHAQAQNVVVTVNVSGGIYLSIKDDGKGIDAARFEKGVGMGRIVSFAEQFKGTVDIASCMPAGCELTIAIPKVPHHL